MLAALEKSLGVVTKACKIAKIERSTHYKWLRNDPQYAAAVLDIEDIAIDFVETHLHTNIKKGDTTAMIFYLKTKAKGRGYIERQEFSHHINGPVSFNYIEPEGNDPVKDGQPEEIPPQIADEPPE